LKGPSEPKARGAAIRGAAIRGTAVREARLQGCFYGVSRKDLPGLASA